MATRRKFIKDSALLSIAGLSLSSLSMLQCKAAKMSGSKDIGLQLYTVRDAMAADPIQTLTALAKMGYTDIEGAGYSERKFYGMTPKEFRKVIDDLGLKTHSGHTNTGADKPKAKYTMYSDWAAACEDFATIGQKYIVCGYLFDFERKSIDQYKRIADLFNKSGRIASDHGLKFAYHNHDFEFQTLEGQLPYDLLLANTDPQYVNYELDLYWIKKAEKDPLAYFKNHKGRFPLWHIKDMEAGPEKFFTEVGNGIINWSEIFAAKANAGMQHFFVEQDVCRNHKPLESVKISLDYINSKGYRG